MECPYCNKVFTSWIGVRGHIPSCALSTKEYYIHKYYGPINIMEASTLNRREFKEKYPLITACEKSAIHRKLVPKGLQCNSAFTVDTAIEALKHWVSVNNRLPISRDTYNDKSLPTDAWVKDHFGSWNTYITSAGFDISGVCGYGMLTKGLDGRLYRSALEAYFSDNYLYNKYEYMYESKYPIGIGLDSRVSDFYLPKLELFIEIAGGLRPEVITEKITQCKANGINLKIFYPRQIYSNKVQI